MAGIKLKLPQWTKERVIRIFAGSELVAEKYPWEQKWKVKDKRCNHCGKCCMNLKKSRSGLDIFPIVDGKCIYLEREPGTVNKWKCKAQHEKPFSCLLDPLDTQKQKIGCCITYKKQ